MRRTGPDSVTAAAGIAFRANVTSNETGQSIGNSNVVRNTGSGQAIGGSFFAGPEGTGFHWGLTAAAQGASTSSTTGMAAWAENTSSGEVVAGRFDAYDLGTGEHYAIKAAGAGSSEGPLPGARLARAAHPHHVRPAIALLESFTAAALKPYPRAARVIVMVSMALQLVILPLRPTVRLEWV